MKDIRLAEVPGELLAEMRESPALRSFDLRGGRQYLLQIRHPHRRHGVAVGATTTGAEITLSQPTQLFERANLRLRRRYDDRERRRDP